MAVLIASDGSSLCGVWNSSLANTPTVLAICLQTTWSDVIPACFRPLNQRQSGLNVHLYFYHRLCTTSSLLERREEVALASGHFHLHHSRAGCLQSLNTLRNPSLIPLSFLFVSCVTTQLLSTFALTRLRIQTPYAK
jgi:hypothetical protein